jgi:hypothetical protein
MLFSEVQKFGACVYGEKKRSNGSGWQRYYIATTEYDKCSNCSLKWGHRGPCKVEDTIPSKPRGAKVVASANLASAITKPKPTRCSSYTKRTEVAGLLLRLREDSDSSPPPSPCQYLAVEVDLGFQPETSFPPPPPPSPLDAVPSMQDFLKDCKLDSYTEDMLQDGFDDVEFLVKYERDNDNNFEKMIDSGDFPIIKPGHVMKLVANLRKLSV